jgi:hypothetical protein
MRSGFPSDDDIASRRTAWNARSVARYGGRHSGQAREVNVIGGSWAIRLRRAIVLADCTLPAGDVCLAEIRGRRARIASDRIPGYWAEIELVSGTDYDVHRH